MPIKKQSITVSVSVVIDLLWNKPLFLTLRAGTTKYLLCRRAAELLLPKIEQEICTSGGITIAKEIRSALGLVPRRFKCSDCAKTFSTPQKALLHKYKVHQLKRP